MSMQVAGGIDTEFVALTLELKLRKSRSVLFGLAYAKMQENPAISDWVQISEGSTVG